MTPSPTRCWRGSRNDLTTRRATRGQSERSAVNGSTRVARRQIARHEGRCRQQGDDGDGAASTACGLRNGGLSRADTRPSDDATPVPVSWIRRGLPAFGRTGTLDRYSAPPVLGGRSRVGQQTLTLLIGVRIPASQPLSRKPRNITDGRGVPRPRTPVPPHRLPRRQWRLALDLTART